ncbi:unnamed protein product [Adineta ricciae]|uniref:Uncharacterized protein n=1 Tax=Adineta ricciae TaxID=249248 RepID=A0A816CB48_ADIRI|nr:unnamed protein product [Adineta ricciae]CAF1619116.1 unnamed protein product [Adineta ricciae]
MCVKSVYFLPLFFVSFTLFSKNSAGNVNACLEYNIDGLYWSDINLCNSTEPYTLTVSKLLQLFNYNWLSIFACAICVFIGCGILFYCYNRYKYTLSPKVTPINVITISHISQSEGFNEPVSFIQLSPSRQPPPSYTNVFSNMSE